MVVDVENSRFPKSSGPMLQQIHPEYDIPAGEVPPLIGISSFILYWTPSDPIFCFCSKKTAQSR
jgi:hypothetical protein